jgi:hypothetical protein
MIFEHLAPLLLDEYLFANVWYPLLTQLSEYVDNTKLVKLVDLMRLCMEQHEFEETLRSLLSYISFCSLSLEYTQIVKIDQEEPSTSAADTTPTTSTTTTTATSASSSSSPSKSKSSTLPQQFRFPPLLLASSLLRIRLVLDLALNLDNFPSFFESLFVIKQPNAVDLTTLIPHVWWPDNKDGLDEGAFAAEKLPTLSHPHTRRLHVRLSANFRWRH